MNPFRYYEAVQTLQKTFDVSRLSISGVNVWMIVRLIMLGRLSAEASKRLTEMYALVAHSGVLFNSTIPLETRGVSPSQYDVVNYGRSAMLMAPRDAQPGPVESVFFELPADYTLVEDGLAVNRIADSFVATFGSRVQKVCRFSPRMLSVAKRTQPRLLIAAASDWTVKPEEARAFRDAVRDLCAQAYDRFPQFAPQQTEVLRVVREVLTYAAAHEAWLTGLGVKRVYMQAFVSFEKYAVLLAAKRLGLPVIDVQHGYCDAYSIYNNLATIRPGDVQLYPDTIWTWGQATSDALHADNSLAASGVDVVVGGDVWGTAMQARAPELAERLKTDLGGDAYDKRILVTYHAESLLNSEGVVHLLPENIHTAIKEGPQSWLWMLRVHPRSLHLVAPLQQMLAESGLTNVEVTASSFALIEPAIEVADVYITGFSVSALEANARGKAVLITDDTGKELFAELIEAGAFEAVTTAADIVSAVEAAKPPAHDAGYYVRDVELSRATFDRLATERPRSPVAQVEAEPVETFEAAPEPGDQDTGAAFEAVPDAALTDVALFDDLEGGFAEAPSDLPEAAPMQRVESDKAAAGSDRS